MYGFGDDKPVLWVKQDDTPTPPQHLAFAARRRADVDAFYAAALGARVEDVALTTCTSDGIVRVLAGLDLGPHGGSQNRRRCCSCRGHAIL